MDVESKLDEDFLFYLGFTSNFSTKITDCGDRQLTNAWLQKLCGEKFNSVNEKRSRNLFLSNLLLQMQEQKLSEPFTLPPDEVDLSDGKRWFATVKLDDTATSWLQEIDQKEEEESNKREDGRTYVATRAMPSGEGAFAYVAVSLADDEPKWLGGREGAFDAAMGQKFAEYCPAPNEMELILARRKDTNERQRVITFYDVLLQNIADELDGKITERENETITLVMDQLIADLKSKREYGHYEAMHDDERRIELLFLLFDRTKNRREKVAKREEYLDDIEASFRASFFANSTSVEEDKYELPAQMWEYAINRPPIKKHMENMQVLYPPFVIEKFMELLSHQKEEVAIRMQRRHVCIVNQMKRELRKEGDKLKKWVNDIKTQCDHAIDVLKAVKVAHHKQIESQEEEASRKRGGDTKLSSLYNEMKAALYDTQQLVEDEAERGRIITEKINGISAQAEAFNQVTECSIMKTEEANMETMKNIKRLRTAISQHQKRLTQMESMKDTFGGQSKMQFFV